MSQRVVDLTQLLGPDTVVWPGSPSPEAHIVSRRELEGSYARTVTMPEHCGTHLDAPSHFADGGAHADEIPVERLVAPCAVLDVREPAAADPDFAIRREHVEKAERRDGPIETGSAVLAWTGWERFTRDAGRYVGEVEAGSFPGFGLDAAQLLVERGVVGLGTDTLGIDPGAERDFPVHHLTLGAGLWHLEGLVNLGALPPRGALLVVGALRLVEGSGTPARVIALVS